MFSTRCQNQFGVLRRLPDLNIENINIFSLRREELLKYFHRGRYNTQICLRFSSVNLKNSHFLLHRLPISRRISRKNESTIQPFSTTSVKHLFWERDPKGGYGSQIKQSKKELVQEGLKELREELMKWQDEVKEKFDADPIFVRPGDVDKIWDFRSTSSIENWKVTCDSDHGEGYSSGSFTLSPTGHGLFHGNINTKVPKDGVVKKAGYCNITSPKPRKSFKRDIYLDWQMYTHLVLRVRGDGRSYMVNINTSGYFDITWNDMYSYVLYTRGGPHWQETRIPFSKFFMSSKGRVQDKQCAIPLDRVVSIGISAGDRINAPYRLEIDHISLQNDPTHHETFAYEMYKLPKYMIGP